MVAPATVINWRSTTVTMTVPAPVDRPLEPRDPRLAPWRAFLLAHARIVRRLDEELRAEHDLTIGEYDALVTIAQAPDRRIRMRQLADEVILSKSGVTRLIDRLVDDGLVERGACLSDARGAEAVLTERGLARIRAASTTHLRGIHEHFLTVIEASDLDAVERTMTSIARHAGSDPLPESGRYAGSSAAAGSSTGDRTSGGC
jgi:DNA-binding MarR family transcriptional regulator